MNALGTWRLNSQEAYKVQRSCATIEMQTMVNSKRARRDIIMLLLAVFPIDVCVIIARLATPIEVGRGRSSYARRRRAISIGRCERCFRVYPPVCNSKCDNSTCVPGLSYNERVANFINTE
ncbi:nucleic acid binding protein [Mirabilis jalapa mottle virus]|uniref:RNA silencing suppressor n=1 Tax=Mirabilis jalapa mottle virus TaxID=1093773 RepID=G5CCX0_9VIRU|nr:nucleic acid binding protein [Mirabilis jalapa mottle virus]AEQ35305.1 nucleic acid binding protein [Mirabilis jalapa mottle virus]